MTIETLLRDLEEKRGALSLRCTAAMYRDPFWISRFGDRGQRHAEEDSAYHVKYVVAALREADDGIFRNYAIWLRGVLTARGMCSWHLAESFRQLVAAMHDEAIEQAELAAAVLTEGERALRYTTGVAADLEPHVPDVLNGLGPSSYRGPELLSFLLDSLARNDSQAFQAHVSFLRQTLAAGETEGKALSGTLDELRARCLALPCADSGRRAAGLLTAAAPSG
jgi:hypothetical protein